MSEEFLEELQVIESILGSENINFDPDSSTLTVQCDVISEVSNIKVSNEIYLTNNDGPSFYSSTENQLYEQVVASLPPVLLICKVSESYPCTDNLISVEVKSVWLSEKELTSAEDYLKKLWTGDPVIFDMITWIQSDMLEYLNIYDEIFISDRLGQYCCDILTRVSIIDRHNKEMLFRNFSSKIHECLTCFCEFEGIEMILLECLHVFCKECLSSFALVQYSSGKYCAMNCPICEIFLGQEVIKKLLNAKAFDDWQERFERQSIEHAPLVLFCPRCNNYAVQEDENLAKCESCTFHFCTLCNKTWHPGSCQNFTEYIAVYANQKKRMPTADEAQNKLQKEQNMLSEMMKKAFMAQCPKCKCWVMRMYGCNHMHCSLCSTDFCYVCGKPRTFHRAGEYCGGHVPNAPTDINDLDEDQKLFFDRVKNRQPNYVPPLQNHIEGTVDRTKCVACRSAIQRIDSNNHAKCAVCKCQFCFLCRAVIKGTNHFSAVTCSQHGGEIKKL